MGFRQTFKGLGLAAAILGLGAGIAVPAGGCDGSVGGTQLTTQPQLPALDLAAPKDFQTATFAFG
ncbi:MAG TPA: hypothetical protein VJP78_08380 [Thermoleophilia bacterium]|nr:hypothetical protein [Thermoleophilia bacterium]